MANLYDMYYSVAMNEKLAAEKDLKANYWADRVENCFKRDAELSKDYNLNIAGGKWNHLMDQTHIGYRSWDEPKEKNIIPKVTRIEPDEAKQGEYVFGEKSGVVVMEAEHYFESNVNDKTKWTVIPDLGRTLWLFFDSTLPFKKGGHNVSASFDGGNEKTWNINDQLTWKNNYSKMYPAGAARMIETVTTLALPHSADGMHVLTIRPLDPGVVFYKVIVDDGGYEQTYLKMAESPYKRE
jgi:hypothetical protein